MIDCEYPDCEEEGEYYSNKDCPEVAACEDHVEWAFEASAKKPKKVHKEPFSPFSSNDPLAIIEGLRNTISAFNYVKLRIEEISARPDIFSLISSYLPAKEVYEYDDEKYYQYHGQNDSIPNINDSIPNIKRIIVCELDGITIYSKPNQGSLFSFGVEVRPAPRPSPKMWKLYCDH